MDYVACIDPFVKREEKKRKKRKIHRVPVHWLTPWITHEQFFYLRVNSTTSYSCKNLLKPEAGHIMVCSLLFFYECFLSCLASQLSAPVVSNIS